MTHSAAARLRAAALRAGLFWSLWFAALAGGTAIMAEASHIPYPAVPFAVGFSVGSCVCALAIAVWLGVIAARLRREHNGQKGSK